jgi:hypothetical protein
MHPLMVLGGAVGVALALTIPIVTSRPAAGQDGAMQAPRIVRLPDNAGRGLLRLPEDDGPVAGVVIVVPDGTIEASRASPHIAALLAGGVGVLQLVPEPDRRTPVALARVVEAARQAIRAEPSLAGARIGALGFGTGAQALLIHAGRLSVAALHPSCVALPDLPDAHGEHYVAQLLLMAAGGDPADHPEACVQRAVFHDSLTDLPAREGTEGGRARAIPAGGPALRPSELPDDAIARVVWFLADLMAPRTDADTVN